MTMSTIRGAFHRAINPAFRKCAIAGSRAAGRYSRPEQPTLYLSSSVDGVEAAMVAHKNSRSACLRLLRLRSAHPQSSVCEYLRISTSWVLMWLMRSHRGNNLLRRVASQLPGGVRDRLVEVGAHGLIDPSRKRPGLWHLVLFHWNVSGVPVVRLVKE